MIEKGPLIDYFLSGAPLLLAVKDDLASLHFEGLSVRGTLRATIMASMATTGALII